MKDKKEALRYDLEAMRDEIGRGDVFAHEYDFEYTYDGRYSAQNYIKRLKESLTPEEFAKIEDRIKETGLTFSSD